MIRLKRNVIPLTQSSGASQADHYQHQPWGLEGEAASIAQNMAPYVSPLNNHYGLKFQMIIREREGIMSRSFSKNKANPYQLFFIAIRGSLSLQGNTYLKFSRQERKTKSVLGCWIVSANCLSKMQGFGDRHKKGDSLGKPNVNYKLPGNNLEYILLVICL